MKQQTEPFTAMGIAAFAMMRTLLAGMVNAGQEKEALIVMAGAREWLEHEDFRHSTKMHEASKLLANFEEKLKLLGRKTEGAVQ